MQMVDNNICFYWDKDMNKPFVTINWDKLVCVNKRQVERNDLYTFSIHYHTNKNKLCEIRLKCGSRSEVDEWVRKFNSSREHRIQKHLFPVHKDEHRYEEMVKQPYMLNPRDYYMKLYKTTLLMYTYIKKSFFKQLRRQHLARKSLNNKAEKTVIPKDLVTHFVNGRKSSYITEEKQPLCHQHNGNRVVDANDIEVVMMVEKMSPVVCRF
jgi:hypothetical protein